MLIQNLLIFVLNLGTLMHVQIEIRAACFHWPAIFSLTTRQKLVSSVSVLREKMQAQLRYQQVGQNCATVPQPTDKFVY